MSFKIFSLQLFGKIKPTESIEKKRKVLLDDFDEFNKVENSDELKKYLELEKWVNSDEFKKKKSEIESLQFKGSKEFLSIKEFEKLKKSKRIKNYFKIASSSDLKRFEDLKESQKIKDYKGISDKKDPRFKQLKNDVDVKFFFKFNKSSLYKNYLDVKESSDLKRYDELMKMIESEEFNKKKAYLEDKTKWQKTEEYAKQQEFLTMKKLPHFVKYFSYKGGNTFDFYKKWEVSFEDDFKSAKLDESRWSGKTYVGEKMLGDNYSLAGDLQVYTDKENIKTGNKLVIEARKEKKTGKIWQLSSGFLPVEMEYTSGVVSSWPAFWQEDGIFEAKIKFAPVKQVVSSFYLSGEQNMPRLNLLESGAKNRVGIISAANGKTDVVGLDISNLKKDKWYIFTVEKEGSTIIWKINESEVFRTQSSSMNGKLHINASVLLVDEIPGSQLPVTFEIEWVKCYRKI